MKGIRESGKGEERRYRTDNQAGNHEKGEKRKERREVRKKEKKRWRMNEDKCEE